MFFPSSPSRYSDDDTLNEPCSDQSKLSRASPVVKRKHGGLRGLVAEKGGLPMANTSNHQVLATYSILLFFIFL